MFLRTLSVAATSTLLGAGLPATGHAQITLKKILRAVTDTSHNRSPNAAANRAASAGGSGGAVRVRDSAVTGADSLAAVWRAAWADTGVKRLPSLLQCGQRACAPGVALRIAAVRFPRLTLPADADLPLVVEIENRGRAGAPAVEVQICRTGNQDLNRCDETGALLDVPALAAGERVRLSRVVRTPNENRGIAYVAVLDPSHALGARGAGDLRASTGRLTFERPAIDVLTAEPGPVTPTGEFPLRVVVRNATAVSTTPVTELLLSGAMYESGNYAFGGKVAGARFAVVVPALGPGQRYEAHLDVASAQPCRSHNEVRTGYIDLEVGPQQWNSFAGNRRAHAGGLRQECR